MKWALMVVYVYAGGSDGGVAMETRVVTAETCTRAHKENKWTGLSYGIRVDCIEITEEDLPYVR